MTQTTPLLTRCTTCREEIRIAHGSTQHAQQLPALRSARLSLAAAGPDEPGSAAGE